MSTAPTFVRVGELACQRNPFLRGLRARVVLCEPVSINKPAGGSGKGGHNSTNTNPSYNVVLTDSVLFPEGGGQPCDHGTIVYGNEEVPVRNVQRRGDTCVISTPCPLEVGEEVEVRVDWPRRFDHMQHHSAQHLLSAVVEKASQCRLPTVSWSLTHPYSFIVLPTGNKIDSDVVAHLEKVCNDAIARAVPVRCDMYPSKEAYEQALREKVEKEDSGEIFRQSRSIPSDVTGPIRIITVEDGIDQCTCCGTHVSNLTQLQMIKLLHQETKGDTLKLFFVTGDRLCRYYGDMYFREKELMKELGGVRPEEFVAAAVKRGKEYADMEKRLKNLTLELMKAESEKLIAEAKTSLAEGAGGGIVVYRRDDVGGDFFNALRDAIRQACPECLAVLAWGSPVATTTAGGALGRAKTGQFMVIGPTDRVESLAPSVCMALEGKGGMSKYGYRGKGNLAGWDKLVQKLLLS
ncbi:hypothetical protein ECC02_004778 [Trypanosoma cruzi]|uniref:Threonyl/alanyl tRNA synthetase SAD domain-containing protein n=1 Tax=Trypanosoma cruzi TaxID=5693 RepID=A0A7J6Y6T2_TRYCR|nr:hypothetical protein ECC02_004778 [Trypanosoma cruzi]